MNQKILARNIQNQVSILEKLRREDVRKCKGYLRIQSLVKILKVITAVIGIAALATFILLPPMSVVCTIIAVILWIFIGSLEKRKNPSKLFKEKLNKDILPEIIKNVSPSYTLEPTFDSYKLEQSQLVNKETMQQTSRYIGNLNIRGHIKNVQVEMSEVTFLRKEVNYGKSSVGCISSILMLPISIYQFLIGESGVVHEDFDNIAYRDEVVFQRLFFAFAHFENPIQGELYLLPKSSQIDNKNTNLITEATMNEFINKYYSVLASDKSLLNDFLTPQLLDIIQQTHAKTGLLTSLSVKHGKLYMLTPLKEDLIKVDLNTKIDADIFDNLILQMSNFDQYIRNLI